MAYMTAHEPYVRDRGYVYTRPTPHRTPRINPGLGDLWPQFPGSNLVWLALVGGLGYVAYLAAYYAITGHSAPRIFTSRPLPPAWRAHG